MPETLETIINQPNRVFDIDKIVNEIEMKENGSNSVSDDSSERENPELNHQEI